MITTDRNFFPEVSGKDDDPVLREIANLSIACFPEFGRGLSGNRSVSYTSSGLERIAGELSGINYPDELSSIFSDTVFLKEENATGAYHPVLQAVGDEKSVTRKDSPSGRKVFDVERIRRDFPILSEKVNNGQKLVWLDNAATTQKPESVIERISRFYLHENSNVHRGAHELAARSTDAYEEARQKVAAFLTASSASDIVFVRGTTEGINLVAQSYVKPRLEAGDEIILSILEHHANIVPWQQVCAETGALIRVIPADDSGQLILSEYRKLFNRRTRFVSVTHVSNALGTVTPVGEMIGIAHHHGVKTLIDAAQSVAHIPVDVQELDADFLVFSGHKIFGPTGIGVVYGKKELLDSAVPYQGGGNMIADVTFGKTRYRPAPARFEAGTGNIAGAVGLGAALDYVEKTGIHEISRYEHELLVYAMDQFKRISGLHLIGNAADRTSVLSFVMDGYDVSEIGHYLSRHGIAVRAGHHCAQPALRRYGLEATVRPSLAFYNTFEEIDCLVKTLLRLRQY